MHQNWVSLKTVKPFTKITHFRNSMQEETVKNSIFFYEFETRFADDPATPRHELTNKSSLVH